MKSEEANKTKEFVIEIYDYKKKEWVFKSEHGNLLSAEANFEASKKKMRVKQNGVVILCRNRNQKS